MGILNRLQLWWNWLTTDPLGFALYLLYFAVSVLLTLILHEIAHGYVAYRCGDPTAKMLGRLSLDPRKHLDPIGTLCLVFLGFGWAKPVPVNPRNFKGNYRRDDFLVSVAGITVNLTLFILSMALAVALNGLLWKPEVIAANGGAREFLSTSGIGYSVLDMVHAFEKANNLTLPYKIVDRRPGDLPTCYADPTKSAQVLGWKAEKNLEDMCRDAWRWQQHYLETQRKAE